VTLLITPRLVLRHFERGDLDDLHAMDSDDRVMRYLGSGMKGRTRTASQRIIGSAAANRALARSARKRRAPRTPRRFGSALGAQATV